MVLPKRRNNLYISILPGVCSVAIVCQRLWMALRGTHDGRLSRSGLTHDGRLSKQERAQRAPQRELGASAGAGSLLMGASAGAGSVMASMPPGVGCAGARRPLRFSPAHLRPCAARRRVPPGADPWPPSPPQRWCLSAVRQPR